MEDNNTYTITGGPLKPHEYVVIKRTMNAGDEAWIQNHGTTISGSKKNPQIELTLGSVRLAALKRMIVRWQLTKTVKSPIDDSETQVSIELSDQAIEELDRRISSHINKVIDRLNPEDEEDDEAFTHAANGSYVGSSHQMMNHHQKG